MMFARIIVAVSLLIAAASAVQFQVINRAPGDIWVGIQGNSGQPALNQGGFALKPNQRVDVNTPDDWAGRLWPRTYCHPSTNHCLTGDCGNKLQCNGAGGTPPATLVEITLKGAAGLDYYDVSLVDGFNIEASIQPVGASGDGGQYSCKKAACQHNLNDECPPELQVKNDEGQVIGCNSACNAFHSDEYCCTGAHSTPATCNPKDWPKNYPAFFKDRCPNAYSYAYDDQKSTFTCRAGTYVITFGG